ncbi:MAG: hypothetical protein J6S14_22000 [Clostridia bacterium]|nr:hypothetical protein [Clostridia bacterium]
MQARDISRHGIAQLGKRECIVHAVNHSQGVRIKPRCALVIGVRDIDGQPLRALRLAKKEGAHVGVFKYRIRRRTVGKYIVVPLPVKKLRVAVVRHIVDPPL